MLGVEASPTQPPPLPPPPVDRTLIIIITCGVGNRYLIKDVNELKAIQTRKFELRLLKDVYVK